MVKSKKRKSRRKSKSRRRSYKCKYGMLKRSVRDKKTGKMRNCKKGPRKVKSRRKSVRKRKSRRKSVRKRKSRRKSVRKRKSRRKSVRKNRRGKSTKSHRYMTRSKRKMSSVSKKNEGTPKKIKRVARTRKPYETKTRLQLGEDNKWYNVTSMKHKEGANWSEVKRVPVDKPFSFESNKTMEWVANNPTLLESLNPSNLIVNNTSKQRIERMTQNQTRRFALYNLKKKLKGNFDLTQDTKNKIKALKEVVKTFDGVIPENFKRLFTPLILKASNENYGILKEEGLLSLIFPVYCTNGFKESEEGKQKLIEFIQEGDYIAALRFFGRVVEVDPSKREKTTDMGEVKGTNCFFFKPNTVVSDILENVNWPFLESFPYTCEGLNFGEDVRGEISGKMAQLRKSKENSETEIKTVISLINENQFYLEKGFMY